MWSGAGAKLHDEPILSITGAAYTSTKTSSKTKKRKEPRDAAPESACGVRLVSCGADGRLVLFELRCDGGGLRLATAAQWQAKGGADCYMTMFSICLLILLFILAAFSTIVQAAVNRRCEQAV